MASDHGSLCLNLMQLDSDIVLTSRFIQFLSIFYIIPLNSPTEQEKQKLKYLFVSICSILLVLPCAERTFCCLQKNVRHTYTLRRDDLRALAWGKRFLGQKPHLFGPLLAALDGKTSLCFDRGRSSLVSFELARFT